MYVPQNLHQDAHQLSVPNSNGTYGSPSLLAQLIICAITNRPVCVIGSGIGGSGGVLSVVDRLITCKSYVYTVKQKSQKSL